MAHKYPIHVDDRLLLESVVAQLRQERIDQGKLQYALGVEVSGNDDFVVRLESHRHESPRLSAYQRWAHTLGLRVELGVDRFWLHSWSDPEMQAYYAMSRPWGAHDMGRLWLVSAVGLWRRRAGFSDDALGGLLGMTGDGAARWERDAHDPYVRRVMWQARLTGTRVTMTLWRREDWVFQ